MTKPTIRIVRVLLPLLAFVLATPGWPESRTVRGAVTKVAIREVTEEDVSASGVFEVLPKSIVKVTTAKKGPLVIEFCGALLMFRTTTAEIEARLDGDFLPGVYHLGASGGSTDSTARTTTHCARWVAGKVQPGVHRVRLFWRADGVAVMVNRTVKVEHR